MSRLGIKTDFLEEVTVLAGLITVHFVFAVYGVVSSYIMSLGITPLFLVVYGNITTSIFLFPFSFYFESKRWPKKLSMKLFGQIMFLAFAGSFLFQVLMLKGVQKTSPAVASSMPNIAPGLIFIIAWALRFEKVNLRCLYSRVKICGTVVCIIGAITMSLMYSSGSKPMVESGNPTIEKDKITGTLCIMAAVIMLSCCIVLQAATLNDFPAPISLSAITSFIAAIFTSILHFSKDHRLWVDSQLMSGKHLVGFVMLGGAVGGACSSFQAWAMKKKGPVFVSTFNPIGTVFSVILSALTLHDSITLGSIFGMFLMFAGLYFVLWAKKKEDLALAFEDEEITKGYDPEKPLLS